MNIRIDKNEIRLDEISKDDILTFVDDSGFMAHETVIDVKLQFGELYTEHIALFVDERDYSFTARKEKKVYELTPSDIITNVSKGRVYGLAKITKDERWDLERQVGEMCQQAQDWDQ